MERRKKLMAVNRCHILIAMIRKNWVFLLALFAICVPFLGTIWLSVPLQDDFMIYHRLMQEEGANVFVRSIKASITMWREWTGGLPYLFGEYILNPLNYFKCTSRAVGIELEIIFVVFIATIFVWIKYVLANVFYIKNSNVIKISYLVFLFAFLNTEIYSQIFYWFIGSVYAWVYILTFITHILMIAFYRGVKPVNAKTGIALSIVGFLTCFNYQVAVTLGFLYLYELYVFCRSKKFQIRLIMPLSCMILGGLISVLAPGNFIRHNEYTNGIVSVKAIIWYTCKMVGEEFINLIENPLVIAMILLFLYLGIHMAKQDSIMPHPVFIVLCSGLCIAGIAMPVAFGQGNGIIYNRMAFVLNLDIFICILWMTISCGIWLGRTGVLKEKILKYRFPIIFQTGLLVFFLFCYGFSSFPWTYTLCNTRMLYIQSSQVHDLYEDMAASDLDVYVVKGKQLSVYTDMMIDLYLKDQDHWVNQDMAYYFHKEAIDYKK